MRSKIRWFTEFCNSHYLSHFAAFFIDARTKRSVVESFDYLIFTRTSLINRIWLNLRRARTAPQQENAGGRHEPYSLLKARQSNKGKVNMGLRYATSAGRVLTDSNRHPPLGARPPNSLMILPQVPQIFASSVTAGGRSYLNHRQWPLSFDLWTRTPQGSELLVITPERGTARHRLMASPTPGGATMANLFRVTSQGLQ